MYRDQQASVRRAGCGWPCWASFRNFVRSWCNMLRGRDRRFRCGIQCQGRVLVVAASGSRTHALATSAKHCWQANATNLQSFATRNGPTGTCCELFAFSACRPSTEQRSNVRKCIHDCVCAQIGKIFAPRCSHRSAAPLASRRPRRRRLSLPESPTISICAGCTRCCPADQKIMPGRACWWPACRRRRCDRSTGQIKVFEQRPL